MLHPERNTLSFVNHHFVLKQLLGLKMIMLVLVAGLIGSVPAQASSPGLSIITPRSVPRGVETEMVFQGGKLADAQEILFYDSGFEVLELKPEDGKVTVKVKVSPECRIGEHVAHVRTASGLSEYRTFWVGPTLAQVEEAEPNNEFEAPQVLAMNSTVHGIVQNEDVDYYVVEAKKGERISAEVLGMRLSATLFDPYVAILDSKRFELSAADDSPLALQDCVAAVVAPEDGKYIIEVRESSYAGNGNCRYILHVGNFPRPLVAYPAGGKMGEETEVNFLGVPGGDLVQKIMLPAEPSEEFGICLETPEGIAPTPNPFRLFEHGNAFEVEPNNTVAEASPVELPLAFNGIISEPGDVDYYKFQATKGQIFEIECFARRIRSPLDSVMVVYDANGKSLASDDDARKPDSYFRYTFPADGEYKLAVYDHLKRGGPDFVYRVEFSAVKPSLTLGIPRVARYSQSRQQIYVARGNKFGTVFSAARQNFGGELVLDPQGLPAGITMHAETMPDNQNTMPVVFEAAADAPVGGALIDFRVKHVNPETNISGSFLNRADYVIANPGQSLYCWKDVTLLSVAVVEELPYTLEIVQPQVPLVRGGSMQLKIVATRKEGFTAPINIVVPYLPPGVGGTSSVTIPEGQNEVTYPLSANGNAGIQTWRLFALGSADVNGTAWVSSQLANLEVAEPYFNFTLERAAAEQGQETEIFCKIAHAKPFEGDAQVTLLGLPAKVTAPEMTLKAGQEELVFKLTTDPTSPEGTHKNIFCRVIITQNNEPILHNTPGTELRIDKPLPPPKDAPPMPTPTPMPVAQKEEPKPPEAKPEKRLTRLEKLRLEAKQRSDAAAAASAGEE
ncbi:putative subtilase-type serine protease precursor [Polystyrenella longa]|uniref:Putative subtilase-type serine protease n=1 Tax=Polystyrenella longa TaxID=2528007 RepID=A0A518CJG7_9PLAN|nr:PPC domain-containing protein [Polystyrenella longa]QDU79378.1 putative subtilase-type serine protease precursor [Polystyrenella longa]